MTAATIYLRSATGNPRRLRRQKQLCRDYLRERELTEAGVITDHGHPAPGLTPLIDAAASNGATEVVVADLSRLGRTPLANMDNFDVLEEAGLTIHVAGGIVSGAIVDACTRDMIYEFTTADAHRLRHGNE